jgi:predicted transcriptional regulator
MDLNRNGARKIYFGAKLKLSFNVREHHLANHVTDEIEAVLKC